MPNVNVRVPTPLRKLTNDAEEVQVDAATIAGLVETMETRFPGTKERLCDESGEIRRFINVFLNDEDVRFLKGKDTELSDGDVISIVPAIAGGARVKRKYYLNVPQKLIKEPIIYNIVKNYDIIPNIRHASVSDEIGIVALEFEGESTAIDNAIKYLGDIGVSAEPIEMNVIGS